VIGGVAGAIAAREAEAAVVGANTAGSAERILFGNKFPLDPIADPKIVPTQALKNMSGNLNYVVLEDGSLVVGKSPHTSLTNNTSVQAAGEIQLYNGKVKWLDNASGHYQPIGAPIQGIAESAFNKIGLDATGKFQYKVWTPDPSLPRGGKWVKQQ
jgi:filamentous hemagglutinin